MSCPNAPEDIRTGDLDCRDGMTPWRGTDRRIPCGWCWRAANYDALEIRQVNVLVEWRDALMDLAGTAQLTLDGDLERGRAFDRLCGKVRKAGVTDDIRNAWLQWCRLREVSA